MILATNRRSFLKGLGSVTALSAITTQGAPRVRNEFLNHIPVGDAVNESFWKLVKEQFTIRPKLIMLNAANLCPSPHMVRDKVSRLTDDLDGDVSFQNREKFDVLREE